MGDNKKKKLINFIRELIFLSFLFISSYLLVWLIIYIINNSGGGFGGLGMI
jgi:hypothetical protein